MVQCHPNVQNSVRVNIRNVENHSSRENTLGARPAAWEASVFLAVLFPVHPTL